MPSPLHSPTGDSANLDVLRAIAVLYVLLGHTLGFFEIRTLGIMPVPWLGRLGVMFFFVLMCLVLMRSLERSAGKFSPMEFSLNFYIRRAFRIYPLSIVFVLGVVIFGLTSVRAITAIPEPYYPAGGEVISNVFLVQNLTFTPPVMGVLWSLPLEVQMCLFLPPLFLLVTRIRSVWPLLILWVLSIPVALIQPGIVSRASLAQYVPHFLPGVIAYYLCKKIEPRVDFRWWIPSIAAISAAFLAAPSLQTGWIVCLALGFSIPLFREIPDGWVRRCSGVVARYSYGIYLCHTICIWLAFGVLASMPIIIQVIMFLVTLAATPALLYHYVEKPMIDVGFRMADRLRIRQKDAGKARAAMA